MSGGLRTNCPECNRKLRPIGSKVCIYCGWNYEKQHGGQNTLFN